ncbi:MAG: winged helix-turn-helix domain-containing protein/riboflavin kinase [Methanocellales archaeon]|nr:winged helix-turn-helix domain-containing protein/riboflavin kinase [Methanocellales archaeon]
MADINALKKLALLGAIKGPIQLSSSSFAKHISSSTQTASRRLQALEREGLISRSILPAGGQHITITKSGKDALRNECYEYQKIFEPIKNEVMLRGEVITGLGEGQYYMSLEGYRTQFKDKLGFIPYPGTLNLILDDKSTVLRKKLDEDEGIPIHGFSSQQRTFGGGKCFRAAIEGIEGAAILPDRSHYPNNVLEVIAPKNLRKMLRLKDGGEISVRVVL